MPSRPSTARTDHSTNITSDRDEDACLSSGSNSPFDNDDDDNEDVAQAKESSTQSGPSSGTLRVLARGNACLCCRRRKLKCDGGKPSCGPCTRGRRVNECLYEEAKIKTKTQILQSRIRELEAKMKRMAEREKMLASSRGSSPNITATSMAAASSASSSRRHTLPLSLQPLLPPPVLSHSATLPSTLRSDSLSSNTDSLASLSGYNASNSFADPLVANLSWTPPMPDFGFGQSELLQNVSSAIVPDAAMHDTWATPTQANSYGTGSWLDLLPQSDATALFNSDVPLGFPAVAVAPPATIAPATLDPASAYVSPSPSGGFSASPSLSNTVTTHSSVSSPPSSAWEDDVRLTSLDLNKSADNDDVPPEISRELIRVFLQHRRQCTFEVHPERFLASLSGSSPTSPVSTTNARPHSALINAIYLLGCHFSPNSPLSQYESLFLARTRKGISNSLENADRLLNFLQASCLLAWYFFFKGRLLEGHYHASAAARFAMSCGLHLLKVKADGMQGTLTFYYPSAASGTSSRSILPQPEDSIALAERINLFWSIFLADRTGSIGTGLPVVIRDEEIETPWPRRFEDFELNDLVRFDSNTLRSLYIPGNTGAYVRVADNLHSVKCKALALNERASRLGSLLESNPGAVSDPDFWPQFDAIDGAITQFVDSLPPIRPPPSTMADWIWEDEELFDKNGAKSSVSPSLVLAYTAAYGAVIQLHRMFSQNDPGSYKRCLGAARSAMKIVHDTRGVDQRYFPMALGIIWTCVAEALAVEYERLRRLNSAQLSDMEDELTVLFLSMKELRRVFPILTLRINKVPIFQGCSLDIDHTACIPSNPPQTWSQGTPILP